MKLANHLGGRQLKNIDSILTKQSTVTQKDVARKPNLCYSVVTEWFRLYSLQ